MAEEVKRVAYRGVRRIIGDNLHQSATSTPHATMMTTVDMTRYEALRRKMKAQNMSLSSTAFFIKAIGLALREFPDFNTRLVKNERGDGEEIIYYDHADAGIAVDTPRGLMMITVRNVANRSVRDLTQDIRDKAYRIKNGKIRYEETIGSTFTISNEMMSKNDFFNSIINNNETFILGVARYKKTPVVDENDNIVIRQIGNIILTYNHKVVDGMPAASFMARIAELMEEPEKLLS